MPANEVEDGAVEAAEDGSETEKVLPKPKARRGFAAMSAEKQAAIASLGGIAAHKKGTAHEFSPQTARAAGRLGGIAAQAKRAAAAKAAKAAKGET